MSHAAPSTRRLVLILGTLTAVGPLAIDMYLPALPTIAADFATHTAAVQQSLAIFFIGLAIGQGFYGPIADRIGRKIPLLVGYTIFTLASLVCALAPSLEVLILARLAQALGGCAGMVIARSMVRDQFAPEEAARIFSALILVLGVAPITAPLIGGQLLGLVGWRSIFWALSIFGALCLILIRWGLPETLPPTRRVRASLGQVAVTYWRLLANRPFVGYALSGGFISAAMFTYIAGSPFVIIELYGVPADRYGWIFGANALGLIVASQLNSWLLRRFTSAAILRTALGVAALAGITLAAVASSGVGGMNGLLVPLFVCIASNGFIGPNTAALALAPHGRNAGSASALLGMLQFGVGTAASALVGVFHNGTALPMAGVIAMCTTLALVSRLVATPPWQQVVRSEPEAS